MSVELRSDVEDLEKQHQATSSSQSSAPASPTRGQQAKEDIGHAKEACQPHGRDVKDDGFGAPGGERGDGVEGDGQQNGLVRVLSRLTQVTSIDPGPPPDGGWRAWSQCLAGHPVVMNTWGWINSFGTFQDYYTTLLDRPAASVSFIGSVTVFLLFCIGTLTGRLTDAGFFRPVFALGTAMQVIGLFATSACTEYWQFMLAQGVCMGIGCGCMFCPQLALLSTYFQRRRALAIGIAACGSATGGIVFPLMARQLLPRVGFAWTVRAIGFIQLGTLILANLLNRARIKPRKSGALVDWAAFREMEYTFYACGAFFCFWGVYFGFYYLAIYSREVVNPPFSFSSSLDLLILLNAVGSVGRLVPNYLADRYSAVNVFIPTSCLCSIFVFCWIAVRTPGPLYGWAVLYGIAAGGIQSLFPAALSFLTTDLRKLGVRMGMIFTIVSLAVLSGPPIAGAIIDATGSYVGAQVFAGTSLAVGCAFLVASKLVKMRKAGLGWRDRT